MTNSYKLAERINSGVNASVTGGMKGLERFNDCHKVTPQDCWLLPHKVLSKAIVF